MTRAGAWITGTITAAVLSTLQAVLFMLFAARFLCWGWWLCLMCAAVVTCTLAGGVLGLCISAYGDLRRTVDIEVKFGLPERVP